MHALRQQLASRQRRQRRVIAQVQLEVDLVRPGEGLLGVERNRVPDPGVGDVDGAEEVGGRVGLDFPEKGATLGCG